MTSRSSRVAFGWGVVLFAIVLGGCSAQGGSSAAAASSSSRLSSTSTASPTRNCGDITPAPYGQAPQGQQVMVLEPSQLEFLVPKTWAHYTRTNWSTVDAATRQDLKERLGARDINRVKETYDHLVVSPDQDASFIATAHFPTVLNTRDLKTYLSSVGYDEAGVTVEPLQTLVGYQVKAMVDDSAFSARLFVALCGGEVALIHLGAPPARIDQEFDQILQSMRRSR